jgi:hypothetical protein
VNDSRLLTLEAFADRDAELGGNGALVLACETFEPFAERAIDPGAD